MLPETLEAVNPRVNAYGLEIDVPVEVSCSHAFMP